MHVRQRLQYAALTKVAEYAAQQLRKMAAGNLAPMPPAGALGGAPVDPRLRSITHHMIRSIMGTGRSREPVNLVQPTGVLGRAPGAPIEQLNRAARSIMGTGRSRGPVNLVPPASVLGLAPVGTPGQLNRAGRLQPAGGPGPAPGGSAPAPQYAGPNYLQTPHIGLQHGIGLQVPAPDGSALAPQYVGPDFSQTPQVPHIELQHGIGMQVPANPLDQIPTGPILSQSAGTPEQLNRAGLGGKLPVPNPQMSTPRGASLPRPAAR